MHRIQCKFIKIEQKLHHRCIVAHTFLLFSLCAVRSSLRCFRSWRSWSFFFSASFARFCSSALLFCLSRSFSSLFSCLAFSLALSWALMSAIIFLVSATPASSSAGRRALVSTPWDRAFSFSFSGRLGLSLCRDVMASNSSSAAARKSQVAVAIALTVCE